MGSSGDLRGASAASAVGTGTGGMGKVTAVVGTGWGIGRGGKEKEGRERSWEGSNSPVKGRKEAIGGDGIGRLDA